MLPTLLVIAATAAAPTPEREVSVGAGAVTNSYIFTGGRTAAGSLLQTAAGRTRFGSVGVEGSLSGLQPLGRTGSTTLLAELRGGYSGERLEVLAGVVSQVAFSARPPLQWLPSLRAAYRFDAFALSGGLFDLQGFAPARLSVDFARFGFGFGYVAPMGGEAHATLPVSERVALKLQLLFVRVYGAELAMAAVSGAFDFGGGSR